MKKSIATIFKPKFRLFFCLVCCCSVMLYTLLSSRLLDIHIDPNSDALEINDGMCRTYDSDDMMEEEKKVDLSSCINPRQFSFDAIHNNHRLPIVTLFTSLNTDIFRKVRFDAFKSVVYNWRSIQPWVNAVLFDESQGKKMPLDDLNVLRNSSWNVEVPPVTSTSGFFRMKDMFNFIKSKPSYHTTFIGYAKPGVLFDTGMIETLMYISKIPKGKLSGSGLLLIARSKNIQFHEAFNYSENLKNVTFVNTLYKNGSFGEVSDINFIITTRTGFPWNKIPDFMDGMTGFERWVTGRAIESNITVIDVTLSQHSVMLKFSEHHLLPQVTTHYNNEANQELCVKKEFRSMVNETSLLGQTVCARYFIKREFLEDLLRVYKRRRVGVNCDGRKRDTGSLYSNQTVFC